MSNPDFHGTYIQDEEAENSKLISKKLAVLLNISYNDVLGRLFNST